MPRTIYVNVNTDGDVGAADWRDDQDELPAHPGTNSRYVVTVPEPAADDPAAITEAMDAFLGDYDLPDDWEVGPIGEVVTA